MGETNLYSLDKLFAIKKKKLVWQGSLEDLKAFTSNEIEEIVAKNTKWKSPGGGTWCFKNEQLSVTWHTKSKAITFEGKKAEELVNRIQESLNANGGLSAVAVTESPCKSLSGQTMDEDDNIIIIPDTNNGGEVSCSDCDKLSIEMAEVKLELSMLWALFHKMQGEIGDVEGLQRFGSSGVTANHDRTVHLKHSASQTDGRQTDLSKRFSHQVEFENQLKNYRLANKEKFGKLNRQQNRRKTTKNANDYDHMNFDNLKQKLQETEQERKSLRTAIKILREEFRQIQNAKVINDTKDINAPWQVVEPKSTKNSDIKEKSKCEANLQEENLREQSLPLSNQYLVLDDKLNRTINDVDQVNQDAPIKEKKKESKSTKKNAKLKSQKDNKTIQKEKQLPMQNSTAQSSDKSQSPKKKVTVVIGDSIIKNIQGWRLSDCNNHVVVKSFGGANCSDMEDYLKPVIRKEPENIILHVGTNDLNKNTSPNQIAQEIIDVGIQINQISPQTNITISEILPRTDKSNLLAKANQVNDIMRKYCDRNEWGYINHKSINETCLNSRGLHLNKKGTAIIAKSISSYIINH